MSSFKDDLDTRSVISMQELDPSPVTDESPDLEAGEYSPKAAEPVPPQQGSGFFGQNLGLRGHSWDSWCTYMDIGFQVTLRNDVANRAYDSICTSEILDISTDVVRRLAFHQHLAHSSGDSVRAGQ